MIIDSQKLNGPCSCGRSHEMHTKAAVIEPGCIRQLDKYAAAYGLNGRRAIIYDENTYAAKNIVHPQAQQEIILDPHNLHANELAVAKVQEQLAEDIDYLIAVGSGTIHDTTRYCANERGIPFISVPTAASVDGFCSTVSAMTWHGYKKTMPGVAPTFVLADLDIIKEAPLYLALSGVGDILGKYTALADWKISHALKNEFFCSRIEKMTRDAVNAVRSCCERICERDEYAFEQLTYGLLLSGLAMQLMGNSRPASGSEHHISHIIEMQPRRFPFRSDALHGEKVGVGTLLAAEAYHELTKIEDIAPLARPYAFLPAEDMQDLYGPELYPSIAAENETDCMAGVSPDMLIEAWPAIRSIVQEIPSCKELLQLYDKIGAKKTLEDIGVPSSYKEALLKYSPSARNRLTLMRVRWMIEK